MSAVRIILAGCPAPLVEGLKGQAHPQAEIELVGTIASASEVLQAAEAARARVVVLDLDGVMGQGDLLGNLLRQTAVGVVALLRSGPVQHSDAVIRGVAAGRLELVRRSPSAPGNDVRAVWEAVKTLTRPCSGGVRPRRATPPTGDRRVKVFGIASSTGGPPALAKVLAGLPGDLPIPILIAQHMTPGFVGGLRSWLAQLTPLQVVLGQNNQSLLPGHVYLAPDGCDIEVDLHRQLQVRPSQTLHCPSADHLLISLAQAFGSDSGAVVLTGMGADGAKGAVAITRAGGFALAQDEATSVVFGMPKAAWEAGGAERLVPIEGVAGAIRRCSGWTMKSDGPEQEGEGR